MDDHANILFSELRQLLLRLEFQERIRGDHHIFTKEGIAEILNTHRSAQWQKPIKSSKPVKLLFAIVWG